MSETILLTGANGKTGRAILKKLVGLQLPVKVFIRDKDQWQDLKALGAAGFAVGDMLDADSIDSAVMGCQKLIHVGPPMHPDEKTITQSLIDAALKHNIGHFIYYSVMHPLRRDVRHHSLKLDTEEVLIESGLPYTILQPIRYMQHLLPIWPKVVEQGIHAMPFNTEVMFNVVDLEDLAEATAIVAAEHGHYFATYELAGRESLSQTDMAAIISEVIGKPVEAQAISLQQVEENARAKGFNEDRVKQMVIMNKHYDDCGFLGNPNVLRWILGRDPTLYREFVERLHQA
ncbi:SDR family oxidoreductase [Oceanicoccus sagamiensis]|uniref:NmrA-like domain-containing protein n=1 Tax=Oceanicoccus sagamiensis TaxID=716816 RepID=A0A1X9NAG9_9GAMM|nr:NmrA family NAD(P)-binding protein [Oceanicoccus sagamiensis]ARN73432.1 hypothetical protein BST96_04475 [Oceanicoccus sagamiensis]